MHTINLGCGNPGEEIKFMQMSNRTLHALCDSEQKAEHSTKQCSTAMLKVFLEWHNIGMYTTCLAFQVSVNALLIEINKRRKNPPVKWQIDAFLHFYYKK